MGEASPVRRGDALRNRALQVEAAREVFAEQGLDAPLDEIARKAGGPPAGGPWAAQVALAHA